MAYIEWWNRKGPITLGERFGLNEISTARKTLSPIKSHTAESVMPSQFDEISIEEMEDLKKQVKFGPQVKDGGRIGFKDGPKNPLYVKTTEYEKRQEASKKGMVYDKETDTIREDIRKKRLVLKKIVPPDRYKEIKLANPGMSEIELQKAYAKLTRNQQDGLIYKSGDHYPNRSGVINPSPAKLKELRHASKLPKSFKIIQDAKIKNTQTNKLWTFEEWKNATQSRRTYHLGLAQDYEGYRAKQKKYMKITQERKGPVGYKSVPNVFRGDKNGLLRWLKLAAEKKNPNYTLWYKDGEVAGVFDKKADTIWRTHTITTEFPNKKHKSIHKHKDFNKVHGKNGFFDMAKKFRYSSPDTVLGRYFVEYGKIPSYSEIYNFLTRPNSKATAKGYNALHKHHTSLVKGLPSKNIQLTLWDRNLNAENLLKRFNTINDPNYKNTEWMDKELKKLNVRMKVSNKMLGAAETTLSSQLSKMKETVTKLFQTKLKENPKLVENLMKHLEIIKNAKGPGRVKAINAIIGLVGVGAAGTLFNKFGISSAEAAEAQTLEPSDKTQEANVAKGLTYGTLGTIAAKYPQEIWEGGKKGLKWAAEKLAPIMLPGPSHILHGGKYDLTSGSDLSTMAFWKHAADWTGKTSKLGDATIPLKKRLKDLAWRGLLPTRFLPLISGAASVTAGPLLIKDAAEWLQSNIDKEGLTGKIEEQSGIIGDEAGASLLMEDVRKKQKESVEGMDYAQGGIASLIK